MTDSPASTKTKARSSLRVLGIDPGLADVGYGVVERNGRTRKIECVAYGVIRTRAGNAVAQRLQTIFRELTSIIEKFSPDEVAVEELFFASNVSTAMSVAQARGVAILASAESGMPLGEYSPPQIKQAVTGSGKADKGQVQRMVRAVLDLKEIPRPDHAADALAVALCHLHLSASMHRAKTQPPSGKAASPVANENKALLAQQRRRRRR